MLCSNCSTSIEDDAPVCRNCGASVGARTTTAIAVATEPALCGKCGATLPAGSLFCLKCGRPLSSDVRPVFPAAVPDRIAIATLPLKRKRRKRPVTAGILFLILIAVVAWAVISDSSTAQQFRDYITGARAEGIVQTPFSVKPHSFASYKFTVPPGAVSVAVSGPFNVTGGPENNIEAYVLTEPAFAVWQSGYSTSTQYESGRVSQSSINASLAAGAGTYYLVFSNTFSPRTAKIVHATVTLHYDTWAPDWLLRLKERLWNWVGAN